jgi:hypothetical protein
MWVFPLASAVVSAAFSALIAQQWLARQRPHQLAWAVALMMFAIASFAAAIGVLDEWTRTWFRVYYLFGAISNVPVLGLGTIYLLGPRKAGHFVAVIVLVASIYAAGAVFTAPMNSAALEVSGIPSGRDVMPDSVRALSRYFSYAGFIVVVAGALWSAWRMVRSKAAHLKNLALGNIFIAAGTFVVALAGVFARYGQGAVFSIALLAGVTLMFWGFLKTRTGRSRAKESE